MDILLVPGFMLDADLWSDIRPALERFGRLVYVDTTQDGSIEAMAVRAVRMMTGPAIVVGFSMGGYVAREIVYQAPRQVVGLALIATSSRGSDPQLPAPSGRKRFHGLSRTAVIRSLHPDHGSEALIARVQRMSRRLGGDVFDRQSNLRREDDTARLGEIICPTLVVAAAQDAVRSIEESKVLYDRIRGSDMIIVDRSGHLIPLERPGQLIEALKPILER